MARTKDLWFATTKKETADGHVITERRQTARHPDRGGNKTAKRWLAIWIDPDGNERSRAFAKKVEADRYGPKQEADVDRDEYIAPDAGKETFGVLAAKFLRLRRVGASSTRRYESAFRLHVDPAFGTRPVKAVRPSEVLEWLLALGSKHGGTTAEISYLIVCGTFDLAVADGLRRDNPARSPIITPPKSAPKPKDAWTAPRVWQVIDEHPEPYRAIPRCAAALGLRQGCVFALAEEDFDFEAMKVHIRRQVTKVGALRAFKLPKGGKERTIPLSRGLAAVVRAQIAAYPPQPYTLPWLAEDGKVATDPHTCRLLFRWFGDDPRSHGRHILPSSYDQQVWKPALHRAGVIGEPVRDKARALRYPADRRDGMHALRHFYSTTLQDAGVSLAGVMDFMGHSREGKGVPLTLGVYGHVTEETFEQGRQAIDRTLFRLRPVESSGTVTELRAAR